VLNVFIVSTVDTKYDAYTRNSECVRDLLTTLKAALAPSDYTRRAELHHLWIKQQKYPSECYEPLVHLKITPRDFVGIARMVRFSSPAGNCVTG
jgi:hypothetical protein